MNDERLAELEEKYKDRNLFEELAWGVYFDHSGYTSKQNGEFLNWLCLMAYKALKERPQGKWVPVSERLPDKNMPCLVSVGKLNLTQIAIYSDLMGTINHKIFYQGDYGKNNFQNITEYVNAWQPLPESYKENEDGHTSDK